MRSVCAEAVQYGSELLSPEANNRRVIVLLNPTANKRSGESGFEKYCAPVLHLAGIRVDIVKTESEGFARTYVETELQDLPDAILVAGGDGTLSEVVTGLMRRDATAPCPIGVLPVGRTNSVAGRMFFQERGTVEDAQALTRAAMAIVRGELTKKDVLQIEVLPTNDEIPTESEAQPGTDHQTKKPIYAMASIKWGAFRDAMSLRDKYWYYGGLRERAAILFNAFKSTALNWDCKGSLATTPACTGCSNCFGDKMARKVEYKGRNWWSFLVPKSQDKAAAADYVINGEDMRGRTNPECSLRTDLQLEDINELYLTTSNVESFPLDSPPQMRVRLGSAKVSTTDWIQDAWQRTTSDQQLGSRLLSAPLECRTVELIPERKTTTAAGSEEFYSIDNEDFEIKPIRITVLPARISMFT